MRTNQGTGSAPLLPGPQDRLPTRAVRGHGWSGVIGARIWAIIVAMPGAGLFPLMAAPAQRGALESGVATGGVGPGVEEMSDAVRAAAERCLVQGGGPVAIGSGSWDSSGRRFDGWVWMAPRSIRAESVGDMRRDDQLKASPGLDHETGLRE